MPNRQRWNLLAHYRERERERRHVRALLAMKFGPRTYTPEQEAFIREVVARRKPLPEESVPLD